MGTLEGSRTRHASGAAGALPRALQPHSWGQIDDAPGARGQVLASESARAYFVSVALPGAEPRSLRVHQAGRRLTVSGSRGRAGRAGQGAARFAFAWDLPVRARARAPACCAWRTPTLYPVTNLRRQSWGVPVELLVPGARWARSARAARPDAAQQGLTAYPNPWGRQPGRHSGQRV
jgi:hypothetical protein